MSPRTKSSSAPEAAPTKRKRAPVKDPGGSPEARRIAAVILENWAGVRAPPAAATALNINWAVTKVVNEELKKKYPDSTQVVRHAVGVDASKLFVARTGIRGSNDLVWVGRAANYAAKMCDLRDGNYVTWISSSVYNNMLDEAKLYDGTNMWESRTWTKCNMTVYRSSWWVKP